MTEQVKIRSCHQPYTTNQEIQQCWIVSKSQNPEFHFLKSIEPLPEKVKMQCIQVDSPSHCYLAGKAMIPTHNSELAAAVALLLTCGDGEQRAEVYGCASDRQQASIVFDVAADMVRMCPAEKDCISADKQLLSGAFSRGIQQAWFQYSRCRI